MNAIHRNSATALKDQNYELRTLKKRCKLKAWEIYLTKSRKLPKCEKDVHPGTGDLLGLQTDD
jgi:hypothetical protein